jgi:hypothetical protein
VRSVPRSRHNPQFNQETLRRKLRAARIGYVHLRKLGGLRAGLILVLRTRFRLNSRVFSPRPTGLRFLRVFESPQVPHFQRASYYLVKGPSRGLHLYPMRRWATCPN